MIVVHVSDAATIPVRGAVKPAGLSGGVPVSAHKWPRSKARQNAYLKSNRRKVPSPTGRETRGPVVKSFTGQKGLTDYGCLASRRVEFTEEAAQPHPNRQQKIKFCVPCIPAPPQGCYKGRNSQKQTTAGCSACGSTGVSYDFLVWTVQGIGMHRSLSMLQAPLDPENNEREVTPRP